MPTLQRKRRSSALQGAGFQLSAFFNIIYYCDKGLEKRKINGFVSSGANKKLLRQSRSISFILKLAWRLYKKSSITLAALMAGRQLRLPIPTNVICGSLNSGKTSLIVHIMSQKPENEVWAVLVNESGAVGIDGAILSSANGAVVHELGGGCLCCTLSSVTSAALVQLIRKAKPDRLLIEPSGLAHPKALLQMLQSQHLKSALDLQPIMCLVDLTSFDPGTYEEQNNACDDDIYLNFVAHVGVADILIGTKADACLGDTTEEFFKWAQALDPPKQNILTCSTSRLECSQVGITAREAENPSQPEGAAVPPVGGPGGGRGAGEKKVWLSNNTAEGAAENDTPLPGRPIKKVNTDSTSGGVTCGWIFHPDDIFDAAGILQLAEAAQPYVMRLKGVFRVEKDPPSWKLLSIAGITSGKSDNLGPIVLQEVPGRQRDSRIEFIVPENPLINGDCCNEGVGSDIGDALRAKDWDFIEKVLLELLCEDVK